MGNLLFSPSGRINSAEFIKAAIILVVLGILLSLPGILGMGDGIEMIASVLGFVLLIPWVFIWIKRYHDAGSSGWMCLVPILIYIIGIVILMAMNMGDVFAYSMEVAKEGGEMDEAVVEEMGKAAAMPMTIGSTILSLVVAFGFNALIKHQPEENQYGHPS